MKPPYANGTALAARGLPRHHLGSTAVDLAVLGSIAAAALLAGSAVGYMDGFDAEVATVLGLIAAVLAGGAVILRGPMACLLAVVLLASTGFQPEVLTAGGADITITDIFFIGLASWWGLGLIDRIQSRPYERARTVRFGQVAAIAFLAFTGLTLLKVAASEPGSLETATTSWLRLVQSATLAWLVASVVETPRQVRFVLATVLAGGLIAVIFSVLVGGVGLESRSRGTIGPNILGLVCGFGVLIALFADIPADRRAKFAVLAIFAVGLFSAKSVASFVAIGFALAVGFVLLGDRRRGWNSVANQRLTRGALAAAIAGLVIFGAVQQLRPEVTPGGDSFNTSSAAQRGILAVAGLEIFERNPVIGVGWRGSSDPSVIGSREIATEVRRRFPQARAVFYPDVNPTSVHNLYVQLLADTGLVGLSLFLALAAAIGYRAVALMRRLGRAHELWPAAFAMTLALGMLLIWHNDNPLFGGQTETVIPVIFIGTLAAISRMTASPRAERP